jgi:hypothetical protein
LRASIRVEGLWAYVVTPYSREFVDALKRRVPSHARKWDKDSREWSVRIAYLDGVAALCRAHFGDVDIDRGDRPEPRLNDPFATILRAAPDAVLKRCFGLVVAAVHPDVGGDHDLMVRVNEAWAQIRKERGL